MHFVLIKKSKKSVFIHKQIKFDKGFLFLSISFGFLKIIYSFTLIFFVFCYQEAQSELESLELEKTGKTALERLNA